MLDQALPGALTLVLREADFEPSAIPQCLEALQLAYRQLLDAAVIPAEEPMLNAAWRGMTGSDMVTAETLLGAVAGNTVSAIDQWEQQRSIQ